MSLKATSLAAASVALLLTVAAAYPAKDDDSFYYSRLHDYNKDGRSWDGIGSSNLLRDLDLLRNRAAFFSRGSRDQLDETKKQQAYHFMDPLMGNTIGTAKRAGCCDSLSGLGIGNQKRNMDEIDRSSFNGFIKKNFDEIDRSGFGSFVKKNFDEIDRSNFGGFVKRSVAPEIPRN